MQIERRILGNATFLGIGAVVGQLANFGFVILVARGFGRDVFAQYAFSTAVGSLACVLVGFGSISLLIKASAQDKSRGLAMLTAILPFQGMAGLVVLATTIAVGFASSMTADHLSILAFIVGHYVLVQITAVLMSQLQGQERMDLVAAVQVGRHIMILTLGITLALTTGSAVAGVSAMPIASFLFLLFAAVKLQNLLGPIQWAWQPRQAWDVAMHAVPFLMIVALGTANERLGVLMLYSMQGSDAVATFASGERIITAVAIAYTILSAATLPMAARLAVSDKVGHRALVDQVARLVNLAVMPAASLLFIFSDDVITILFGNAFASSSPVLRVFALVLVIRSISTVMQMTAISAGRQRDVVTSRLIGLFLMLLLGLPMIQIAGPLGLAFAVVGAEVGNAVALKALLRRASILISPLKTSLGTIAACSISIAIGMYFADADLVQRVSLALGSLGAGLWVFGAVGRHDLEYLWAVLIAKRSDVEPS